MTEQFFQVSAVLTCLANSSSCPLSSEYRLPFSTLNSGYQGIYIPAGSNNDVGGPSRLIFDVLNNLTSISRSNISCGSDNDCSSHNLTCVQGTCAVSLARYHDAYDPGIEIDYQIQFYKIVNSSLPNWTQSLYGTSELRAFWKESDGAGIGLLMAGLVMTGAVYYGSKKLQQYFTTKFKF
jgi:hypothetical protein